MRRSRERERRRRARLRRRLGGATGLLVIAGIIALLALSGGARQNVARAVTPHPPAEPSSLAPFPAQLAGDGLRPGGLATIRRLISLGSTVYCGGTRGREVALTFDDGPGVYTHLALRKLRRAHQRATFFVVGKSIDAWPGYLRPESGVAALGDHTFTHSNLVTLSPQRVTTEIARTRAMIERGTGQRVLLFRPPYGARDAAVNRIVHGLGLLDIMWSVDSADSLGATYAAIIRNVQLGLRPGAIIEMHDNRGQTIRALTALLPVLRARHLRSVSVLQLLADDPPSAAALRRGAGGCGPYPRAPARAGRRAE